MEIAIHCGAHQTDNGHLFAQLRRNCSALRNEQVLIPAPRQYRIQLSNTLNKRPSGLQPAEEREALFDVILDHAPDMERPLRLVLSHETIFGVPKLLCAKRMFYGLAEQRLVQLRDVFRPDSLTLYLAIRDPASFLPAVLKNTPHRDMNDLLRGLNPLHIRWSNLIFRIRETVPDVPVVLWCNEDAPLLTGMILRHMAGMAPDQKIKGAFALLSELICDEGMKRLRHFLKENPTLSEAGKRRAMSAVLARCALPGALHEEVDVPGWDSDYVNALSSLYLDDLKTIARMDGVTVLTP
ncbi:hypothetical protein [Cognatishimia sp. F0-27]|uniref:hypothetical protein n=1 Tax=Cognatishimia sp. F0-27 TaxID=2816855 RepID=UPI001D0C0D52|nr:hypothetical protein [Cognatishimia sp. F0-27]MCC1491784.1 hypothetical protein [Cognatishimia sp. F0-27]